MEPGNLVKYEGLDGYVYYGYVLYLETDSSNEVFYHVRWNDGTESDEPHYNYRDGVIKVIQ
jgi:hypothetical protein